MKSIILFASCLFLTACGTSNTPPATAQPIDYFNKPVKVAMVVVNQASGIQASDLLISGVSRTTETVILNFSITVTNSGSIAQEVSIALSGRDRYNLEALAPIITAAIQPGETRIINQQQQFTATLLYQAESWLVQSVGPTIQQPTTSIPPAPIQTAPIVPEQPQQPQVIPMTTDTSGTIQLLKIEPIENFRTNDHINFSTMFQFQNLSSSRINFHWTINGLTATDALVFSRVLNSAIDGSQTYNTGMSYGEPLTIAEYGSITKWIATDFSRY